jgi:hypothetical protein
MACCAEVFVIEGLGFTVTVNVPGVPLHPAAEGVTVNVEETTLFDVFVPVNEGTVALPDAGDIPTAGFDAVQANAVPFTFPEKLTAAVRSPAHMA